MDLKSRLALLRRESGAEPAAPAPAADLPPPAPDLAQRLERSGARRRPRPTDADLAAFLGGAVLAPGLLLLERRQPLAEAHGHRPLADLSAAPLALLDERAPVAADLLFFDTETTGLAGGTGTVAFMVGLARVEGDELAVRQYLITAFAGERALLAETRGQIESARALVSFNGRSFDAPLLSTRYRLAGMADPLAGRPHLDLLHPTRAAYGNAWPDCRLKTAEERLLGFQRQDDLPGWMAPEAWQALLQAGDPRQLPGVALHNRLDVLSLAALAATLARAYAEPGTGADPRAVARRHAREGRDEAAFRRLLDERARLGPAGLLELADWHRRREEWEAAVQLWEEMAAVNVWPAVEALAKYHEHQRRDYAAALQYARRLAERAPGEPGVARRVARLETRDRKSR